LPCNDVNEKISVSLDGEDRLRSYRLTKITCGGEVGRDSLLLDRLGGLTTGEIIEIAERRQKRQHDPKDHVEEFLTLKHLNAVSATLRAYTGDAPGGALNACTIVSVNYDSDGTVIEAEIDVDLLTEQVKACAHCGPG
jgi:hypothetical protein